MPVEINQTTKCEKCGGNMILREGKYGQFYGCSSFPRCRNTKPYRKPQPERPTEVKPNNDIQWSEYQKAIFALAENLDNWKHLVIQAGAGSGKTTVGVEFAARLPKNLEVAFVAFNVKIAHTFATKLPANVHASTLHSLGLGNAKNALGNIRVEGRKVFYIIKDLTDRMPYDQAEMIDQSTSSIIKFVSLCKANLMEPTDANLDYIADRWNVETNGDRDIIYETTRKAYRLSIADTKTIDFDDMIYLSATGRVPCKQFDILVVDETQDLNKANLEMVIHSVKPNGHIVAVGDVFQSIYGFRGADTDAMPNMIARLDAKTLPLSITYRVPKSGVALANTLVPELEAAPNAKEGILESVSEYRFLDMVESGDLVLCRCNAPLVKPCFDLIRQGRKAVILGRDIGSGLISMIQKIQKRERVRALDDVLEALSNYRRQEIAKLVKQGKELAADNLDDKVETIFALADGCYTVADLERRIKEVFRDNAEGVTFSTIHKSKGGEADRVFILKPGLMPHPKATAEWEIQQEWNVAYVAYTRHKEALYFVGGMPLFEVPDPDRDSEELILDSEEEITKDEEEALMEHLFGEPCGFCNGDGETDSGAPGPQGNFINIACPECNGTGRKTNNECLEEKTTPADILALFPPDGQFEDNIYRFSATEITSALSDYTPTIDKDQLILEKELGGGSTVVVYTSVKVGHIAGGTGSDSVRVVRRDVVGDKTYWHKEKTHWLTREVPKTIDKPWDAMTHIANKIEAMVQRFTDVCPKCGGTTIKIAYKGMPNRAWWKCLNGCK